MSRSKLLITMGLILLMTLPVAVAHAQSASFSGSGTALISDGIASSDKITLSLSGVAAPEEGEAYEGWLVNSSGDKVSLGILPVVIGNIDHSWTSPDGDNLLGSYDRFVITAEPVPDSDPEPSDKTVVETAVAVTVLAHIRHLVVAEPGGDTGFIPQLAAQVESAMSKISDAQGADSIADLRSSTQEALDIIDADDGILALAQSTSEHSGLALDGDPGNSVVAGYAEKVSASGVNVQTWASDAKEQAAAVLEEDQIETAKVLLNIVNGRLEAALSGTANQDGANAAYTNAQKMATFQFPPPSIADTVVGEPAVPAIMQWTLLAALVLLIGGGAMLYRERRAAHKA